MELDFGFTLGGYTVLPRQGILRVGEKSIHLEPKVMGVLVALARRPGEVIRHEEFLDEVWPGVVVGDEVLSRSISILRGHLGDDSGDPHFIQTVPKVGYRLVAAVQPHEPAAGMPPKRNRRLMGSAAAAIVIAAGAILWLAMPRQGAHESWAPPGETVSMAVARFVDRDMEQRQIGAGLVDELMSDLSRVPKLRVMYRAVTGEDPCHPAVAIDADTLLTGSVQTGEDRIRVSYQWYSLEDCQLILSNTHEAPLGDVFEVQNAISKAIVGRLALARGSKVDAGPPIASPGNSDAYRNVLVGRTYLDIGRNDLRRRGEEPIRRSIRIFEQAIHEDPDLVTAHLRLAEAYAVLPGYAPENRELMYAKALAELDQVERLDGTPVRTYATRAQIHAEHMEFEEAAEMFRLAIAYTPSDGYMRQWYSVFLSTVGFMDGSLEQAKTAAELDPTSPVNIHRLAIAYLWANENELADRYFALAQSVGVEPYANPEPYLILLLRQKRYDEVEEWIKTIQKAQGRTSEWVEAIMPALRNPGARAAADALTALDEALGAGQISTRLYWGFLIVMDQVDRALDATLPMVESGNFVDELQFLFVAETAPLRASPRFAQMITAAGLDRFWDKYGWPEACTRAGSEIRCH